MRAIPPSRQSTENPYEFRDRFFSGFHREFSVLLGQVDEALARLGFAFSSLSRAHSTQRQRHELISRHALPFFGVVTSEDQDDFDLNLLVGCLSAHTLALTHLDYHLDGSDPDDNNPATAVKMNPELSVAYAVRMSQKSAVILHGSTAGRRIFSEVIEPISGFVIERMHEDSRTRRSTGPLRDSKKAIQHYLHSRNSRLMGSGYWDVMLRAGYISCHPSREVPTSLERFGFHLRRLRQLVDECHDWEEDLRAGLATLPVILRCADDPTYRSSVIKFWSNPGLQLPDSPITPAVMERMEDLIRSECRQAYKYSQDFGDGSLDFLVDLKLAKYESFRRPSVPFTAASFCAGSRQPRSA